LCRAVVAGRSETLAQCRGCAARHLALALKSGHRGRRFTCFLRVHNFWLPIIVRGCLVGLAFVQALALPVAGRPTPRSPLHGGQTTAAVGGASRFLSRGGRRIGRGEFGQAAKLLRLVFQHVETSALADLRQADLNQAQQALLELQTVATRLRTELNGLVPAFNKNAPALEPENHTDRLVHAALEYIHQHYAEAFTLQQYAGRLRVNAAYLSALFSRAVGTPFKAYLTEVRLERARELLGDPSRSVAEVAYAVGYASENRFRIAFKHATGLSPRLWRETLRMAPRGKSQGPLA
jgi:AraC-like DNA-binding protein